MNRRRLPWPGLFLLGGVILTAITLALFESLGATIYEFYFQNVVSLGLVMAPFLALSFAGNSDIRVSGLLSRAFAPLTAVTLTIFLGALAFSYGKLFAEREAFFVYSIVPIVVMAIVFFVSSTEDTSAWMSLLCLYMTALSLLVLILVLPAAMTRTFEGVTPNRLALLGLISLLLFHTAIVLWQQLGVLRMKKQPSAVSSAIVGFLPVYLVWSAFVAVGFPVLFAFH